MPALACVNGRLLPADQPALPVTDPAVLYGEGLFETIRAYRGRVFRLDQHLDRLASGAAELKFPLPARADLERAVAETLTASELPEASVRLTLTPNSLIVLVRPLALPPDERYRTGCRAVTVPLTISPNSPLRRVKSLNYLDKLLAQREAERAGAHEAILIDEDGCVVEAARRNIFAVVSGALLTPSLSRGLLPGITRAAVLELAAQRGLPHAEQDLPLTTLLAAEECFLTSSLAEILPVASVDGAAFAAVPGPLTQQLASAYRQLTTL